MIRIEKKANLDNRLSDAAKRHSLIVKSKYLQVVSEYLSHIKTNYKDKFKIELFLINCLRVRNCKDILNGMVRF